MTFTDCDIGICACGVERRLYRPEGQLRALCQPCVIRAFFAGREPRSADTTSIKRREAMRARRERLRKNGTCIDCGRMPSIIAHVRCARCNDKVLNYRRRAAAS